MKTETIHAKQDSVFSIRFPASFGEGYSWRLAEISDSTCITLIKMTQIPGAEDKDGSCETQVFFLRGDKKGKSTLRFVYEQPWLKEKSLKLQYKLFLIIIS